MKKGTWAKKETKALTKNFPAKEKYRLTDQIIRSARSINANIAEGHFTYKDPLHFCIQAQGSLSETLNHFVDAFDCTYITQEQLYYYKTKVDEVANFETDVLPTCAKTFDNVISRSTGNQS